VIAVINFINRSLKLKFNSHKIKKKKKLQSLTTRTFLGVLSITDLKMFTNINNSIKFKISLKLKMIPTKYIGLIFTVFENNQEFSELNSLITLNWS